MPSEFQTEDSQPPVRRKASSCLERGVLLVALLSCVLWVDGNVADPDLWGHVQFGRDALSDGLPTTATYSYTAEGHRWINHETLAELALAIGMGSIGPTGLLIFKSLSAATLVGAFFCWGRRRGYSVVALAVSANLIAAGLRSSWLLRPHLFSYLYFGLILAMLEWCFVGWQHNTTRHSTDQGATSPLELKRLRALWLMPLLICLWTNSHGGFVAGYCILVAYLVFRTIEAIYRRGRSAIPVVSLLLSIAFVSGLATLANPYGIGLHQWMLGSLGVPRPEISEWLPPDLLSQQHWPLVAMLLITLASLLLTRGKRDLTHLAILALILWQSLSHTRHIPFLMMACGLWTVAHFDSALRRLDAWSPLARRIERPDARRAIGIVLAGVAFMQSTQVQASVSKLQVDCRYYPVVALQYIVEKDLQGRMVVPYNWGQYVLAVLRPTGDEDTPTRVSIDGRFRTCYSQEVIDMNFDFEFGPYRDRYRTPGSLYDDERVLQHGSPDIVLVCRDAFHSVNVMCRNQAQWTLLYQDATAQIWGRTSKHGDPASAHFISPDDRFISNFGLPASIAWPAIPAKRKQ